MGFQARDVSSMAALGRVFYFSNHGHGGPCYRQRKGQRRDGEGTTSFACQFVPPVHSSPEHEAAVTPLEVAPSMAVRMATPAFTAAARSIVARMVS